ncbi:sensor histidine kinase [Streptomyces sp. NPDC051561]|uniref:sensor histidine kinase n=1 Tax=Streptomyces sp. NPDC051561 TaxID=3365658 RepID=UPI0037ABF979
MESQTEQSSGGFTAWPPREALSRIGVPRVRMGIDFVMWMGLGFWILWEAYDSGAFTAAAVVVPPLALASAIGAAQLYDRFTLRHRLLPALGVLGAVTLLAVGSYEVKAATAGAILLIVCAVQAMQRLPLVVGLPASGAVMGVHALMSEVSVREMAVVGFGVVSIGYMLRLDAQARGSGFLLLAQERAARVAEAESAALAERARIAREMHDVLAHSLSAQMVHLEAARLLVEREPQGPFRDAVLERVVAARTMAREGLAETRQALSALRGDMAPVGDYLRELAALDRGDVQISGTPRKLTGDASQALRRVAQEALTNVRKHAPGAAPRIVLEYLPDEVALEIRDSGRPGAPGSAPGVDREPTDREPTDREPTDREPADREPADQEPADRGSTCRKPGAAARGTGRGDAGSGSGRADARRELAATGCGYGLLGMRERAELLGGTLEAGPEGKGFVVRLRMPV